MSQSDPVIERWQEDVSRISYEVVEMHHNRNVYRGVIEIAVKHGGLPPSAFFNYLNATYGVTQVAAVRRQADRHSDVVSLHRLLTQIKDKPRWLTRDGFVERYGTADDVHAGLLAWGEHFAGRVVEYVDRALVKADLDELHAAAEAATQWANNRVAHTKRERVEEPPTLGELDRAIDTIGHVFERYNLLLQGSRYFSLAPQGVNEDLNALFRQPWIRS